MQRLILLLLLIPFIGTAQPSDSLFIRAISEEILRNGKAYDLLRQLTKQIGGRLAGSPQFAKAVQWGRQSLSDLNADTVYLQQCMVPHWVRGGKDQAKVTGVNGKKEDRTLDILALGNSLGTGIKGINAEVVAVSSFEDLETKKDNLKGKIVFYNAAFNPVNLRPGNSYGQTGIYRRNGASRAAKYGALAVLVRSLTEATDNIPHTGAMTYNDSFPKIPAAAVGLLDADYLWDLCKKNSHVNVSLTTMAHFQPDTIGHNVVAELKGSDNSHGYITVGGHLDSWDVNEGAHDDGTGIVQTMEVLRVLKALQYKPKHTIRFVLFANEENGLRGAQKYAEEAGARNEKHVFALESDNGGFDPKGFSFTIENDRLEKIQAWKDLLMPYGVYELRQGGGGSDVGPLNEKFKIPVAELIPDSKRYFDIHHARSDVFEAVNKRELLFGAIDMAALIYLVDKYGI